MDQAQDGEQQGVGHQAGEALASEVAAREHLTQRCAALPRSAVRLGAAAAQLVLHRAVPVRNETSHLLGIERLHVQLQEVGAQHGVVAIARVAARHEKAVVRSALQGIDDPAAHLRASDLAGHLVEPVQQPQQLAPPVELRRQAGRIGEGEVGQLAR